MTGEPLSDSEHIARLCGFASLDEDGAPTGASFMLRQNEEYLSVNWLDLLSLVDRHSQIHELRHVLVGKGMTLGATAKLAVHQVGALRDYVRQRSEDNRDLKVLREPLANDDSHCGIFGLRPDASKIADLIAEIVEDTYPARAG
jgi:hypothetical protein